MTNMQLKEPKRGSPHEIQRDHFPCRVGNFFLNENRGATPPGNRNQILTEETKVKLQRGGTYALPNQWLGNEGRTGRERYNSRNSIRSALQEKLKSTKPVFDRRMKTWLESAKML
jgi:hypothetical protein